MNLQELLTPIRDLIVWTFEILLEGGLPNLLNIGIILLIVATLAGWLKMQAGFTRKAKQEGGII